ncbi:MAG: MBL fold metallo-hydrolase [Candidatus Methylophosphatis roskildensis]
MGPRALFITDEICQVGGSGLSAPNDAAVYLMSLDGCAVLIDAGCGDAEDMILANLEAAGSNPAQIEALLLTHCHYDHSGGAAGMRRRLGCKVVAHVLDAPFIESGDDVVSAAAWYGASLDPCVVDRKLGDARDELTLGGRAISAIHIPGHSPGSVAYLVESQQRKVLFAQDVHGPLHPSLLSNKTDYRHSLQRLLELDADILCEGHYGIFEGREEVAGFIRRFLD